jgi:hypothetical protein
MFRGFSPQLKAVGVEPASYNLTMRFNYPLKTVDTDLIQNKKEVFIKKMVLEGKKLMISIPLSFTYNYSVMGSRQN